MVNEPTSQGRSPNPSCCPKCGSAQSQRGPNTRGFQFTRSRRCLECGTPWLPGWPTWAGVVVMVAGFGLTLFLLAAADFCFITRDFSGLRASISSLYGMISCLILLPYGCYCIFLGAAIVSGEYRTKRLIKDAETFEEVYEHIPPRPRLLILGIYAVRDWLIYFVISFAGGILIAKLLPNSSTVSPLWNLPIILIGLIVSGLVTGRKPLSAMLCLCLAIWLFSLPGFWFSDMTLTDWLVSQPLMLLASASIAFVIVKILRDRFRLRLPEMIKGKLDPRIFGIAHNAQPTSENP